MIETQGVSKTYGALTALRDLTLNIGAGEVFGFIGPNGAGKSTTMKILAGLITPDAGRASVCGVDVRSDPERVRSVLGYMPDFLGVYEDLTVDEYLQFFAAAYRIARSRRRAVVDGVLELTDLTGKRDAPVDALSRGMQQRLGVARVLIHDPKVLLLDEPASGLDPRARIELRELLLELKRMGKCIMVSSHILTELAEMCTSIGIIERGNLLFAGSVESAFRRAGAGERIVVTLEAGSLDAAKAAELLSGNPRVARARSEPVETGPQAGAGNGATPEEAGSAGGDGSAAGASATRAVGREQLVIELVPGQHSHHELIEALMRAGGRIAAFTPRPIKLEEVFLRLTGGGGELN